MEICIQTLLRVCPFPERDTRLHGSDALSVCISYISTRIKRRKRRRGIQAAFNNKNLPT